MTITPDTFPAGTRVAATNGSNDRGAVAGWVRDSVVIRWDNGGTSSGPASHGGIRHEDEADELAARADELAAVAELYPAALPLVENGWTVGAAIDHVTGTCDRAVCGGTHPTSAEIIGRATGSRSATVTHETRHADGSLTVDATDTWDRA